MPKFIIHAQEVHIVSYEVEAEDMGDAIDKVLSGDGVMIDDSQEYSHTLDSSYWTICDGDGRKIRSTTI